MPRPERTPSATTSRSHSTSKVSSPRVNVTAVTRPPSTRASTALAPSRPVAPASIASVRMRSSSSVRGTAEPWSGREPPGQGSSRVWPKPCARRPRLTVWSRTQSPRPSRSSSAIARGVSPSPQVLSRGKTAASASTTSRPARAAHAAAEAPEGPAPTTRTSVRWGVWVTCAFSQPANRRAEIGPSTAPTAADQARHSGPGSRPCGCASAVSRGGSRRRGRAGRRAPGGGWPGRPRPRRPGCRAAAPRPRRSGRRAVATRSCRMPCARHSAAEVGSGGGAEDALEVGGTLGCPVLERGEDAATVVVDDDQGEVGRRLVGADEQAVGVVQEGEVAEQGVGRAGGAASGRCRPPWRPRRRCRRGRGWRAPRRRSARPRRGRRHAPGCSSRGRARRPPGSPSTTALATPRPLGHGNGCAATASARRRAGAAPALAPAVVVIGRGGAAEAQGVRGVHGGGDVRRVGPLAALGHHLDAQPGAAQEGADRARQGRPADHDDPVRGVGVEPVGGGEQQRTVGHGFGPHRGAAERLGDDGVTALGGPGGGALAERGVAGVADDDEGPRHLGQRRGLGRPVAGVAQDAPTAAPSARPSRASGHASSVARSAVAVRRLAGSGSGSGSGASGSRRQTLRCTGPGLRHRWRRSRRRAPGRRCCARTGPSPGRDDRRRQVDGVPGARPEDAGLLGGLVRAGAAQLVGPVGADDHERGAGVVGLEHRGVQVGDGRAGRRHHGHRARRTRGPARGRGTRRCARRPARAGAAARPARRRARRRPAAPTGSRGTGRPRGRRSAPARRPGPSRGRRTGSRAWILPPPARRRSSDTERTGRPSTPPAEACQASRPGHRAAGRALGDAQGGDVALEPVAAHVDG